MKKQLRKLVKKAVKNMVWDEEWDFKGMSSARAIEIGEELMYASDELIEYKDSNFPNLDNDGCPKGAAKEFDLLFQD